MIVIMVVVMIFGWLKGLRAEMAAMTGAAGNRIAGVLNLADVLCVDLLGHFVH